MELISGRKRRNATKRSSRPNGCLSVAVAHHLNLPVFTVGLSCVLILLVLCLISLPVPLLDMPTRFDRSVTLLIWWLPFGKGLPLPDCWVSYGVSGCTLTADRTSYESADAVIMHHRELATKPDDLPWAPRPPWQKWIWMNFESPSHSAFPYHLDGMFNLTMSYHSGSDIFLPYGQLHRRRVPADVRIRLEQKRGLVAWVISNWREEHERVRFYRRLLRYVQVDVYGRQFLSLVNDSVVQTVSPYKFYLAFENSLHTDYITEKLWRNALLSSAVPVVLGPPRENYERFLPADAFIHVDDFKGPRALADYLKYLDRNPSAYRRFFEWRRYYSVHVTSFWDEHFCTACQAVQARRHVTKTAKHLSFWFES